MTIFILACATAVLVSFLCSMLEAVLLSLDSIHLETKRREGHHYADIWQKMKQRIDRPIAAILILNTVAHTGGATVAGSAFNNLYGEKWIWLFSLVFTIVVLLGTEIIPKVLGVNYSERLAPPLARLLSTMTTVFSPLIAFTEWVSKPFKRRGNPRRLSLADLRSMTDMARSDQLIGGQQQNIILNASKLRQTTVTAVMVPREHIAFFNLHSTDRAKFQVVAAHLHTRYPVSRDGTVDGVVGYVNFKEITTADSYHHALQIEPFLRPLFRVNSSASLNDVLKTLIANRQHIALVENEHRQVVGMVALEDILEEIVGDLTDEFDQVPGEIIPIGENRWNLGGGAKMASVSKSTGISALDAEAELMLSDWLHRKMGREPRPGDVVRESNATFTVMQTRRHKTHRVLVERRA